MRLRVDLGWNERTVFQKVIANSDFWGEVPLPYHRLVRAEFKAGEEEQRIDLLYLRNDGWLVPCELKIGGTAKDSHGQLLRYTSDLHYNPWTLGRVMEERGVYDGDGLVTIVDDTFDEWLTANGLDDPDINTPVVRGGILIDEAFPAQLRTAVRYLNSTTDLTILLVEARGNTEADWTVESAELWMRLDFSEIDP